MNKPLATSLIALGLAIAGPAAAQDSQDTKDSTAKDWAGFYIGIHYGHGSAKADTDFSPLPTATQFVNLQPTTIALRPSGSVFGGQLGYSWQSGHAVWGFQGDVSSLSMDDSVTRSPITQNNGTPFFAGSYISASADYGRMYTLRARLGYATNNGWLFYGTGGFARAKIENSAVTNFRPVGSTQYIALTSDSHTGHVYGLGAAYKISEHMSVNAEYTHFGLGDQSKVADATPLLPPFQVGYHWQAEGKMWQIGFNYHF